MKKILLLVIILLLIPLQVYATEEEYYALETPDYYLCNTFSFITSQTLAYMMNSLTVSYVDIRDMISLKYDY